MIKWEDMTWAEQYVADRVLNDIENEGYDEDDIRSYISTIACDAEFECPEDDEFICDESVVFDYVIDRVNK